PPLARAVTPALVPEPVRDVLYEARHNVLPLGRDGRVFGRGYHCVYHRPLREPAVLGFVPRPLEVLEGGADHDLRVLWPELLARHGSEIWQLREREVDLRGRAAVPEVIRIRHDLRGQVLPADQREQGR